MGLLSVAVAIFPLLFFFPATVNCLRTNGPCRAFNASHLTTHEMREVVREMFFHAYTNYMALAFPADQLAPQTCKAYKKKSSDFHLGGYVLTLIESLSTLAVMGEAEEFRKGVDLVAMHLTWKNNVVSVFEANIRVLGGLLSAHMLASDPALGLYPDYNGHLLDSAKELGQILLQAFDQKGIPAPRINLKTGRPTGGPVVNLAAGTTFLLEFGALSRLLGDPSFEEAAERSVDAFWGKRSSLNLVGSLIDRKTENWIPNPAITSAGVGSGSDSFYEYLLKYYILSGDPKYWEMWQEAYRAILKYIKNDHWYIDVDMNTGQPSRNWVDSFQAFFPGLMVLSGDIENATHMFSAYHSLWKHYGFIPDVYKHRTQELHQTTYPLRPEFPESTWYLYVATKDEYYLQVGKEIVEGLQRNCRTLCGFAGIQNVIKRNTEDQMDSYFFSETLKYLYLLFDEDNFVNKGNYIFNTEGHFFPVLSRLQKGEGNSWTRQALPKCAPMKQYGRRMKLLFTQREHRIPVPLLGIPTKSYSRDD